MIASVFCGASLDGYIARLNGDLDFLPEEAEPHGYDEFVASIGTHVIGRETYETVHGFDGWPYGDKRVVVLSSRPIERPRTAPDARVEQMAGEPAEIVARLEVSGARSLYVDGGATIQRFLEAGLITRLIVTRVPVLIGTGRPLFGALSRDIRLRHVATRSFPSGLVQSEYAIEG